MEQQTAYQVFTELNTIRQTLQRIEQEIERLTALVVVNSRPLEQADYLSVVSLGASGLTDVSERHDHYVGEAIADEHLR